MKVKINNLNYVTHKKTNLPFQNFLPLMEKYSKSSGSKYLLKHQFEYFTCSIKTYQLKCKFTACTYIPWSNIHISFSLQDTGAAVEGVRRLIGPGAEVQSIWDTVVQVSQRVDQEEPAAQLVRYCLFTIRVSVYILLFRCCFLPKA